MCWVMMGKCSALDMGVCAIVLSCVALLASLSAISFPLIPVWLGSQSREGCWVVGRW